MTIAPFSSSGASVTRKTDQTCKSGDRSRDHSNSSMAGNSSVSAAAFAFRTSPSANSGGTAWRASSMASASESPEPLGCGDELTSGVAESAAGAEVIGATEGERLKLADGSAPPFRAHATGASVAIPAKNEFRK